MPALLTECLGHAPAGLACDALDLDVGYPTRRSEFVEPQLVVTVGGAAMDELGPREVVEVPGVARDEEPSGNHGGGPAGGTAVGVDVAVLVLPEGVRLQLEQIGAQRRQQATGWAHRIRCRVAVTRSWSKGLMIKSRAPVLMAVRT